MNFCSLVKRRHLQHSFPFLGVSGNGIWQRPGVIVLVSQPLGFLELSSPLGYTFQRVCKVTKTCVAEVVLTFIGIGYHAWFISMGLLLNEVLLKLNSVSSLQSFMDFDRHISHRNLQNTQTRQMPSCCTNTSFTTSLPFHTHPL